MIARLRSNSHWLILGSVLVLAAALRFYKIGAQSLWYDEGNSARIAERSLSLIIEGAAGDIHPPLYYIALKYWQAVFGASETALRSLSALCGALTVLFTYAIGRDLFDRRTGLLAAWLMAFAPFAVYYSQEARMYALLALCAAASTWALFRLLRAPPAAAPAVLYIVATAAGLYTHYAYPFVMIAQGACALLWGAGGKPFALRQLGSYLALSLLAVMLYLPWLPIAARQVLGWGVERPGYSLGAASLEVYRTLAIGRTLPPEQSAWPMTLFSVCIALGLAGGDRTTLTNRLALLILTAMPVGLLFAFDLYREAYLKFLLVSVLPLMVLAARGIHTLGTAVASRLAPRHARLTDSISAFIVLALAATLTPSLRNLYDDPAYARDDYRGIQRLIATGARPDDAVLFLAPNQWEVYTYYQRDDHNLFPLTYRPESYEAVAEQMRAIAATHGRIFALYFAERDADPEGWYEFWMSGNLYKVHERWVGDIRLVVYDSGMDRDTWSVVDGARFGDAIALINARSRLGEARPGDVVPVELTWQGLTQPGRRYKVFVHIGPPDGAPVAQHDSEPVAGYRPTDGWSPDERIVDRRGAWITPGTPPGTYAVFVGLYDPDTGVRLPVAREGAQPGDRLKIGEITIR